MIPIQPLSVKFPEEERAQLKALAAALGWSESQVVRDSVAAVIYLAKHPEGQTKIVGMARQALRHEGDNSLLKEHVNRFHFHASDKVGA
jgi:hypothetical protein